MEESYKIHTGVLKNNSKASGLSSAIDLAYMGKDINKTFHNGKLVNLTDVSFERILKNIDQYIFFTDENVKDKKGLPLSVFCKKDEISETLEIANNLETDPNMWHCGYKSHLEGKLYPMWDFWWITNNDSFLYFGDNTLIHAAINEEVKIQTGESFEFKEIKNKKETPVQ